MYRIICDLNPGFGVSRDYRGFNAFEVVVAVGLGFRGLGE